MAIKKVLQDKRFKNRELQIMKMVNHPNIVKLKQCFYSTTEKDETYLHLVLEYVPDTVSAEGRRCTRRILPVARSRLTAAQQPRGWIWPPGRKTLVLC